MKAQHLAEEITEAQVPHWTVLIKDDQGFFYEVESIDFRPTSDQGGLVILSTSPSLQKGVTT